MKILFFGTTEGPDFECSVRHFKKKRNPLRYWQLEMKKSDRAPSVAKTELISAKLGPDRE